MTLFNNVKKKKKAIQTYMPLCEKVIVKFSLATPITARYVKSINHLNRAYLTKWSRLKELKKGHIILWTEKTKQSHWHVSRVARPFTRLWDSSDLDDPQDF